MKQIFETEKYSRWFARQADKKAKAAIAARIRRAELGNLGDRKSVGGGVSEMRVDVGQGYRVYCTERDLEIIVLLAGGAKSSQSSDIEAARKLAHEIGD